MAKASKRGRPKKAVKYTKTINIRLTPVQWLKIMNEAHEAYLEPSVFIRKTVLEYLNIRDEISRKKYVAKNKSTA